MSTPEEIITNIGAVGAVATPWWLPHLSTVSEIAALIAPILGVIWLAVQIVIKLRDYRQKAKFRRDLKAHLGQ